MNERWRLIHAKREAMIVCGFPKQLVKNTESIKVRNYDIRSQTGGRISGVNYDFGIDLKRNGSWGSTHMVRFIPNYRKELEKDSPIRVKKDLPTRLMIDAYRSGHDLMDICYEEATGNALPETKKETELEKFLRKGIGETLDNQKERQMRYSVWEYVLVDRRDKKVVAQDIVIVDGESAIEVETLVLMQEGITASSAKYMQVMKRQIGSFDKYPEDDEE